MTLPPGVAAAVEPVTGPLRHVVPVGGGCVSHATRVEAAGETFFLKWAEGAAGRTFEAEARGLRFLRAARDRAGADLVVPAPLLARDAVGEPGLLLLDWLEPGRPTTRYWAGFGLALARLHRAEPEGDGYGADADNWIGRSPQSNRRHTDWPAFFRDERLGPQIALARASGRWRAGWDAPAERLLARLDGLLPAAPPRSALHGDLWGGNALALADGRAALVDPAAYVGDREADLAMTELFGGFAPGFYDAYREAWPLEPGYTERRGVYNLYHVLNHLNLFGAGYAGQVEATLRRFG